jgi:hypothetical protein
MTPHEIDTSLNSGTIFPEHTSLCSCSLMVCANTGVATNTNLIIFALILSVVQTRDIPYANHYTTEAVITRHTSD